ncbi:MAG: zinc ribbon domain-containing protein, partial [Bacilli bacterium]|nr:zinc ribbon domain-containing protein [Bacilli bacterium]
MSYYCHHCGKEVGRGNKFCPHCGVLLQEDEYGERPGEYDEVVDEPKPAGKKTIINESTKRDLDTVVKILMIVITVLTGFAIIPLLWTIPMTMTALDRIKKK